MPESGLAQVTAGLRVDGAGEFTRDLALRGPGDVLRLSDGEIGRVEPVPGSRDCSPNFFPYVELRNPALPWTYTPAMQNPNGRLMPWLVLVVLREDEGVTLRRRVDPPIDVLSIAEGAGDRLPVLREAFAWAHVHDLSGALDPAETYRDRPDQLVARLMCPVRLDRNAAYVACLVPAFEAGRQAGLGREVDHESAALAWKDGTESLDLPVYHHWRFSTGLMDFETAVRRLTPYRADESVGLHDLDISAPRGGLNAEDLGVEEPDPVSFQGALVSPIAEPRGWKAGHRTPFQAALLERLSPGDVTPKKGGRYYALRDDPVVTPPVYGAPQAGSAALAAGKSGWQRTANLEPPHRAAAGLGSEVVRRHQEEFMAVAWATAREATEVTTTLRQTRLALAVGERVHARMAALSPTDFVQVTTGVHHAVRTEDPGNPTVTRLLDRRPDVEAAAVSPTFRRIAANPVKSALSVRAKDVQKTVTSLCLSGASMTLNATLLQPAEGLTPTQSIESKGTQLDGAQTLPLLDRTVGRRISAQPGKPLRPDTGRPPPAPPVAAPSQGSAGVIPPAEIKTSILDQTRPVDLMTAKIARDIPGLALPSAKPMPIPRAPTLTVSFDEPVYRRLTRISPDLLLPGFAALPDDIVSVMNPNPAMIEAFLLGLNHEMSREFAWRRFPTLLNGTWFRRFWDYVSDPDREDIKAIADWKTGTALGGNGPGGTQAQSVVLVKGELFRRFPDTRVYAVEAAWEDLSNLRGAKTAPVNRLAGGMSSSTRVALLDDKTKIMWPEFEGRIGGQAAFFGFPLDAEDLRGDPEPARRDAGWFIVFEQPESHPKFGLDDPTGFTPDTAPRRADDLSWGHFAASEEDLALKSHATAHPVWEQTTVSGARWGATSAQTARLSFQNAVRILFHAGSLIEDTEG